MNNIEISIVIPCKNEASSIGHCINEAQTFLARNNLNGEIIIIDNGSTDSTAKIASEHGARVIYEMQSGYGRALRTGFENSNGEIIITGDGDATYDFENLEKFYEPLKRNEYDFVIGNRFAGGIERGAMPLSHKIGVKILSALGRLKMRTGSDVVDFHCGLRGITRYALNKLKFKTTGMEFATEMIILASHENLRIGQVPVTLRLCKYDRKSKLHTISDGFRHLRYIFLASRRL